MKLVKLEIEIDASTPEMAARKFVETIVEGACYPLHIWVEDEGGRDHHIVFDDDCDACPACPDCKGLGAFPETGMTCDRCLGGGTVSMADDAPDTDGWTNDHTKAASAEGWNIFDSDTRGLEIQRVDDPEDRAEPRFAGDGEAVEWVKARAREGSPLHILALEITKGKTNG